MEAARVDGAGELRTFFSVVFPMIKPGVGALAIFTFVNTWNDYFLQLVMLQGDEMAYTLPLGISNLQAKCPPTSASSWPAPPWPPCPSSSCSSPSRSTLPRASPWVL